MANLPVFCVSKIRGPQGGFSPPVSAFQSKWNPELLFFPTQVVFENNGRSNNPPGKFVRICSGSNSDVHK